MYEPLVGPLLHRYTYIWHCNRLSLVPIIHCSFVRSFVRSIHFYPIECDSINENKRATEREREEGEEKSRAKEQLYSVFTNVISIYTHKISAFHQIQLPFGELKMFPFLLTFSHASLLIHRSVYLLRLFTFFPFSTKNFISLGSTYCFDPPMFRLNNTTFRFVSRNIVKCLSKKEEYAIRLSISVSCSVHLWIFHIEWVVLLANRCTPEREKRKDFHLHLLLLIRRVFGKSRWKKKGFQCRSFAVLHIFYWNCRNLSTFLPKSKFSIFYIAQFDMWRFHQF